MKIKIEAVGVDDKVIDIEVLVEVEIVVWLMAKSSKSTQLLPPFQPLKVK